MAQTQSNLHEASLLGIPLEIRHMIFELASTRDYQPNMVFRNWFEKNDVNEQLAQLQANNPNGATPIIRRSHEAELDSEDDVSTNSEDEEEQDDEDDGDEEQEGGDDEDEHIEAGEDDLMHEDILADNTEVEAVLEEETGNEADMPETHVPAAAVNTTIPQIAGPSGAAVNATGAASTGEADDDEMSDSNADAGGDDDEDGGMEHQDDAQEEEHDEEEEEHAGQGHVAVGAAGGMVSANGPVPVARPVIQAHHKWRHVPKLVRITQCPPPINLFLICKQLNAEAKNWFYNIAIFKIDATASFQHFSFFEVALGGIADAAFSPMENIRKAEITFVWDSTWVRAEPTGYAASVFSYFLQVRAEYVLEILQRAPDLQHVLVHWHDTADDDEARALMQDVLQRFVCNLAATIDTKIHLIAADVKPNSKSIAGKRRLEFQDIIDNPREAF